MPRVLILKPDQLQTVPTTPGVYLMRNSARKVIYVGKAINLKRRLQSYFPKAQAEVERVSAMTAQVAAITVRQTGSELEALLLEASLIKKYQPPFNQKVKNYQRHVYLKVNQSGEFPCICVENNYHPVERALYFGPFSGKISLELMLDSLNQIFKLRTCDLATFLLHADSPCARFAEGLCSAPCAEQISTKDYQHRLKEFIAYLTGFPSKLLSDFLMTEDVVPEALIIGYRPANYHNNQCIIVLPDLTLNSYKILAVFRGEPYRFYTFNAIRHGVRKLENITRDIYRNFQVLQSFPIPPVSKDRFEEAKLIDRWLHHQQSESLVIDLESTSMAACQYQLKRYLLPSCQLSLLYETASNGREVLEPPAH